MKSDKPVILIGAQRNASSPGFGGPRNLLDAIRIATTPHANGEKVMVATFEAGAVMARPVIVQAHRCATRPLRRGRDKSHNLKALHQK